jgi:hypothetical protein
MTNLLIIALLVVFAIMAYQMLEACVVGFSRLCCRVADRASSLVIIIGALSIGLLLSLTMISASHH